MYIKIPYEFDPNNPFEVIDLPQDTSAWLKAVYKHLECTTIDVASSIFPDLVLVLDDNGKMTDDWPVKINQFASALYPSFWDPIVGNVILARRSFSDLEPLTLEDIEQITTFYATRF